MEIGQIFSTVFGFTIRMHLLCVCGRIMYNIYEYLANIDGKMAKFGAKSGLFWTFFRKMEKNVLNRQPSYLRLKMIRVRVCVYAHFKLDYKVMLQQISGK